MTEFGLMKTDFGLLTDRPAYKSLHRKFLVEFKVITSNSHFPQTGFVRISAIIAPGGPIPVSKSTWWQRVRDGRFPAPIKLGPKTTVWRVEDILALIERVSAAGGGQ